MRACQIPSREKRSEARNLTRFAAPCCQNSVNLRPASRLRRAHCHAHSQPAPCEGTSFRRFRTRRRCVPSFTLPSHWASENAHDAAPACRQRAAITTAGLPVEKAIEARYRRRARVLKAAFRDLPRIAIAAPPLPCAPLGSRPPLSLMETDARHIAMGVLISRAKRAHPRNP